MLDLFSRHWIFAQNNWGDTLVGSQGVIQEGISNSVNELWEQTLNSELWNQTVVLSTGVLILFMVYMIIQWVKALTEGEFTPNQLMPLFIAFGLALLLANQGAGARGLAKGVREMINQFNSAVLDINVGNGINLSSVYANAVSESQVNLIFQQQLAECSSDYADDEAKRTQCYQQALTEANEQASDLNLSSGFGDFLQDTATNLSNLSPTKYVANFAFNTIVISFLAIMNAGFQWMIEITWLLSAFLLPISLAFSVIPLGSQRPVILWFISFWAIGFCKFCFNLLNSFVALLLAGQTDSLNGLNGELILAVMIGLFSPILSFALASGGAKSVFDSMSSFTGSAISTTAGMALGDVSGAVMNLTKSVGTGSSNTSQVNQSINLPSASSSSGNNSNNNSRV